MRTSGSRLSIIGVVAALTTIVLAQEPEKPATPPAPAKSSKGDIITPKGRSTDVSDSKIVDRPARYYLWTDSQGWHLRTAAPERNTTFTGSLELSAGSFGKVRDVGLELKSKKAPDAYRIDGPRRKLEFSFITWKGPDGIDFDLAKAKDAEIAFELKIAEKPQPKRIFIGKENLNPTEARFTLPAEP